MPPGVGARRRQHRSRLVTSAAHLRQLITLVALFGPLSRLSGECLASLLIVPAVGLATE